MLFTMSRFLVLVGLRQPVAWQKVLMRTDPSFLASIDLSHSREAYSNVE